MLRLVLSLVTMIVFFRLPGDKIKQNNKTSVIHFNVVLKSFTKRIYMIKNTR